MMLPGVNKNGTGYSDVTEQTTVNNDT